MEEENHIDGVQNNCTPIVDGVLNNKNKSIPIHKMNWLY